jgi:hypothetical protein
MIPKSAKLESLGEAKTQYADHFLVFARSTCGVSEFPAKPLSLPPIISRAIYSFLVFVVSLGS